MQKLLHQAKMVLSYFLLLAGVALSVWILESVFGELPEDHCRGT